ncbi:hypothetical protein COCC4DRAFT_67231 [Bipolaris maydis ATCC 48331]|uniref:3-hydroxyacyl-CoA dehydrogenase-like protein LAM1 n=1 Tax=Cochliobolus heterostrophus (strain C4 / ATCC 48331 / race T) TaxID=665024 RepID=LAM1_COCH4|nr:uncharacterized protein COCC4DRAFT_67231 [Bipolaris maydis ATCC 48331]N4WEA4.1 RecName: Full=3-hydroxyacyl-CoA dehydrogenase-like protein LAM1; AltName: Full=T-toxin biosynthesis protein LAM1 [Bipolaris maydis ATCC 48331]ACP43390.1 putative 3-hydroxyacyl-CoA dehydrogenase [Bipolaris maydis]ENH98578.1 hypothetical protein COCC4DRAFT_67231 [Bipolaris maydis ATCC 48331]KAJ5028841.1 hypothetical protein J3E73DRAFT_389445 [Bipolaris maydis]KAJ5063630.1 putative 3-hydroxyacyl-CoA dehydrogenase [B
MTPSAKRRTLNTHYFMPPHVRVVELMTSGNTAPEIMSLLVDRMKTVGLKPFVAKRESTGFIQNRVWASIKREMLHVVAEGIVDAQTADDIFVETIVRPGTRPFAAMDYVGLDTVANIERTYAQERHLDTTYTVDYLQREFIDVGKLGIKSNKGGFYPPSTAADAVSTKPRIFVLDNGLSGQIDNLKQGKILEYSFEGEYIRTVFKDQYLPDGIAVSQEENVLFWTCMGSPGQKDGMIYAGKLDGNDIRPLIQQGIVHTPKQIVIDEANKKLYFTDREGLCIWRCDKDGSNLEQVVVTGDNNNECDRRDATRWCVGITFSHTLGKIFWTQKGASKGWQGRIFSANMTIPPGETAAHRKDKVCLLEGLAEPIDLDFHESTKTLYWTDRGEMPFGNTLNRLRFDDRGYALHTDSTPHLKHEIIARKFHEAIGLKIDARNEHVYVADLGGSICRCKLDGSDKVRLVFQEDRAWTGVALA